MKHSQAALEFLMTYGWALLIVMIAIGGLAYMGVLNPNKLLPERCAFDFGIVCLGEQYVITDNPEQTAKARLRNDLGGDIILYNGSAMVDVPGVTCSLCLADPATSMCTSGAAGNELSCDACTELWKNNQEKDLIANCTGISSFGKGQRITFTYTLPWYPDRPGNPLYKTMKGEISGQIS